MSHSNLRVGTVPILGVMLPALHSTYICTLFTLRYYGNPRGGYGGYRGGGYSYGGQGGYSRGSSYQRRRNYNTEN